MTIEKMSWVGDDTRIHIQHHLQDIHCIRETIVLYPDEALAIHFWLTQNRTRLLDACARQLKEQAEKEGA